MTIVTIESDCPFCGQPVLVEEEVSENSEYFCKYPTDNGPCERPVDNRLDYCWQHDE